MADKRENIDIIVELHDRLSRPADKAGESVTDLRDDVEELNTELEEHDEQTKKSNKSTVTWTKSTTKASKAARTHADTLRDAKKALVAQNKELSRGSKALNAIERSTSRVDRTMGQAARGGGKALRMALMGLVVVGVVPFLYAAVGAVAALGAAAYAAVAGLAPLVGVLGAMPTLISALLQPMAAVKLGFKGFGESMKVLSDPESTLKELRDTLKAMTPEGRALANTLLELKEQTTGWSKSIQSAMFPGFTAGLKALGPVLPIVEKGLRGSGWAVGQLVKHVGQFVGGSGKDLDTIMTRNTRILNRGFAPALLSVLHIFRDIIIAGGPLAERFSLWVAKSADNMERLVRQGRNSGRLEAFFGRAGDLASDVKDVLFDLGVALFNIGKGSERLGDAMGRDLTAKVAELREWTESSGGKKSIRHFFADAIPVVRELGRWVLGLTRSLGGVMTNPELLPLMKQIRTELAPALARLGGSLATGIGPAVIDFFTGLADALASLPISPLLELVKAVGFLTKGLGELMQSAPALGTLASALLTIVAVQKVSSIVTGKWNAQVKSGQGIIGGSISRMKVFAGAFDTTNRAQQRATMSVRHFELAEKERQRTIRRGFGTMAKGAAGAAGLAVVASGAADKIGLSNTAALAMAGSLAGPWGAAAGGAVGLFMDMKAGAEAASSAYTDLKDNMVTKVGKSDELRAQIAAAQKELDDINNSTGFKDWFSDQTTDLFTGGAGQGIDDVYGEQIDKAKAELTRLTDYEKVVATQDRMQAMWARRTQEINNNIDAMRRSQDAYRSQFDAETRLREAQKQATAQAASNKAGIDGNTDAALANRSALSTLSGAWNSQSRKVKNNVGRYKEMRAEFVKTIENMGVGKKRANELADELLDIPKKVETRMVLKDEASEKARLLREALERIDRMDVNVPVRITTTGATALTPGFGPQDPTSFSGNPTAPGFTSWVGEMGPELWMPRGGGPAQVIGAAGMEKMTFGRAGYIVPNPSTPASMTKPLPQWVADRLDGDSPASGPPPGSSGGSGADSGSAGPSGGSPEHLHVHFDGDGSTLTKEDIRTGALQAYRQWERERSERR